MGEQIVKTDFSVPASIGVDTFGGKVHVEWDPHAAVTPFGQLPFFIEFLKVSGLFDNFVTACPLEYTSPNAPSRRDVLGTLLMSILAGHNRYAHITSIRLDPVNPELLGMKKVVSEDAVRRALKAMDEDAGIAWLDGQLRACTNDALSMGQWILDTDTTVKCLYGKQEGAVVGYNPIKPGRPSHNYHSCFMGNTRLALAVEVNHGNQHAAKHVTPSLWSYYDSLSDEKKPAAIRGDIFLGNESFLSQAESRGAPYLTKLRLTANVKRLITKLFREAEWVDAGHGFEGTDASIKLTGWSRPRRVVVLRRLIHVDIAVTDDSPQLGLAFIETTDTAKRYEYAVLVTSLPHEILTIAQLYRDRADCENCFDELKNQWGWGGYTTSDLKPCRLVSRMVALVYNWWSIFVRLARPHKHHEAITSRPLLLHGVARQTKHAGKTTLTISNHHAKTPLIQAALQALTMFLDRIRSSTEQLRTGDRIKLIIRQAFRAFLDKLKPVPLRLTASS